MTYINITKLMILLLLTSCNPRKRHVEDISNDDMVFGLNTAPISQYVTDVLEDSKGNLWFGTLDDGIAKYKDGVLQYLTVDDGLPSNRVTGIVEANSGDYWLLTGAGLSRYDGTSFENIPINKGKGSETLSTLFIDSRGELWVGTWNGVFRYIDGEFVAFPFPTPEVETNINPDTKNWITVLQEDDKGNMWFAKDGYGLCKYDGNSFKHYLKKDGLLSNNVTNIEIDDKGDVWVGTRVNEKDNKDVANRTGPGGVNKMTSEGILSFPTIKGFNRADVYGMHKDHNGHIWISTLSDGLYKYDGTKFVNYDVPISIMCMTYDKKGVFWIGGAGGLYRIDEDDKITYVTRSGPWE